MDISHRARLQSVWLPFGLTYMMIASDDVQTTETLHGCHALAASSSIFWLPGLVACDQKTRGLEREFNCRIFFHFKVAFVACCLGYFYFNFDKKQPLAIMRNRLVFNFLLFHRFYQALGHIVYFLGRKNEFTRFAAFGGYVALNDSVGFLAQGLMLYSPSTFIWGMCHFSIYLVQRGNLGSFLCEFGMAQLLREGFVHNAFVVLDIIFNVDALRRQLELDEVMNSSFDEKGIKSHPEKSPKTHRRASFAIKKHVEMGGSGYKIVQSLTILSAATVWILQQTDPSVSY